MQIMKLCIYQQPYKPVSLESFKGLLKFVSNDTELVVDTIHDIDELIQRVSDGEYAAVFAKHPEDYHNEPLDYLHLMLVSLNSKTKVYEINSFNELTSSFLVEQREKVISVQTNVIKRHINFIERH